MVVVFDMNRVIWWMLPIEKFEKNAARDLVDLMDARKKSVSGSLDENPELKSKWEKVFYQRFPTKE